MGISREGMGELKREKQRRQEEEQRRESDRDQELALQQRVDHEVAKRVERAFRERSRQAAASESPKRRKMLDKSLMKKKLRRASVATGLK